MREIWDAFLSGSLVMKGLTMGEPSVWSISVVLVGVALFALAATSYRKKQS